MGVGSEGFVEDYICGEREDAKKQSTDRNRDTTSFH